MWTYANCDEKIVYNIVKAMHLGYDSYKDKYPGMSAMTLKYALAAALRPEVKYHAAAVKYFKEIGAWTPEIDKVQEKQVALETERLKAWEKALAEAKAKGIKVDYKNAKWKDLWYGYLNAIK
jgi:hypothetical protein